MFPPQSTEGPSASILCDEAPGREHAPEREGRDFGRDDEDLDDSSGGVTETCVMERVLLIAANREHFPEPAFPLGAAYVAGALEAAGVPVRLLDAGLEPSATRALRAVRTAVARLEPTLVGLSLRNIDNAAYPCTESYVGWYDALAAAVHALPGRRRLVLGGSGFSIFPNELLQRLGAEAGVTGDGEQAMVALAGGTAAGPLVEGRLDDLSAVGLPADLDGVVPAIARYATVGVQTARGCPYACAYCTYPLIEGTRLRRRPPERVADEVERLHRERGIAELFIVDSAFNADEDHMEAVARALRSRRLPVVFSCYLQPRTADHGLFRLLKEAGCIAVDFGTDSASDEMLSRLGKSFTVADLRAVSAACTEAGLDFCHSLLFGGPGETPATIAETVRLMDEISPKAVVAMAGVRVYPGTPLARLCQREAGETGEAAVCATLAPRFYGGHDRLRAVYDEVRRAAGPRRSWFLPGSRRWSRAWGPRLLRALGGPGPLWRSFPRPRWYRFF
jgi:radical SAM superfamily enzyme YgiQ (UPF0313 family)